jgi:hypothetical protein
MRHRASNSGDSASAKPRSPRWWRVHPAVGEKLTGSTYEIFAYKLVQNMVKIGGGVA